MTFLPRSLKYFFVPPGPNVIKKIVRNIRIFIISQSACYTRLEKLAREKHYLTTKIRKCGHKKFYKIGPDVLAKSRINKKSRLCSKLAESHW